MLGEGVEVVWICECLDEFEFEGEACAVSGSCRIFVGFWLRLWVGGVGKYCWSTGCFVLNAVHLLYCLVVGSGEYGVVCGV